MTERAGGRAVEGGGRAKRQAARGVCASAWAEEDVIPIVEECLRVGKRPVASAAVRVYTRVTERPVQERVPLREEHLRVERTPVDRPIPDAAMAFREDVIEIEETSEEPVVAKEARVVEEVVISKETNERVEEALDRVRRTEVEGERAGRMSSWHGRTGSAMSSLTMAAIGRRPRRKRAADGRSVIPAPGIGWWTSSGTRGNAGPPVASLGATAPRRQAPSGLGCSKAPGYPERQG